MPWQIRSVPAVSDDEACLARTVVDNVSGLHGVIEKLSSGAASPADFEVARARLTVATFTVDVIVHSLAGRGDPLAEQGRCVAEFFRRLEPVISALERGDTVDAEARYSEAMEALSRVSAPAGDAC